MLGTGLIYSSGTGWQEAALAELVGRVRPPASSGACRLAGLFPALLSLSLDIILVTPNQNVGFILRFTHGEKGP